jgi:AhpD family alkylhydroperoxidase
MSAKRLAPQKTSPDLYRAVIQVDSLIRRSELDPKLMELVKIRASQINGCGFCLDMHIQAARKLGEDQRRLDVLAGWRETERLPWPGRRA